MEIVSTAAVQRGRKRVRRRRDPVLHDENRKTGRRRIYARRNHHRKDAISMAKGVHQEYEQAVCQSHTNVESDGWVILPRDRERWGIVLLAPYVASLTWRNDTLVTPESVGVQEEAIEYVALKRPECRFGNEHDTSFAFLCRFVSEVWHDQWGHFYMYGPDPHVVYANHSGSTYTRWNRTYSFHLPWWPRVVTQKSKLVDTIVASQATPPTHAPTLATDVRRFKWQVLDWLSDDSRWIRQHRLALPTELLVLLSPMPVELVHLIVSFFLLPI